MGVLLFCPFCVLSVWTLSMCLTLWRPTLTDIGREWVCVRECPFILFFLTCLSSFWFLSFLSTRSFLVWDRVGDSSCISWSKEFSVMCCIMKMRARLLKLRKSAAFFSNVHWWQVVVSHAENVVKSLCCSCNLLVLGQTPGLTIMKRV